MESNTREVINPFTWAEWREFGAHLPQPDRPGADRCSNMGRKGNVNLDGQLLLSPQFPFTLSNPQEFEIQETDASLHWRLPLYPTRLASSHTSANGMEPAANSFVHNMFGSGSFLESSHPSIGPPRVTVNPGHNPKERYQCLECSTTFTRIGDHRRHMKKHGLRQFKCLFSSCDKTFYRKDKLRDHIRCGHKQPRDWLGAQDSRGREILYPKSYSASEQTLPTTVRIPWASSTSDAARFTNGVHINIDIDKFNIGSPGVTKDNALGTLLNDGARTIGLRPRPIPLFRKSSNYGLEGLVSPKRSTIESYCTQALLEPLRTPGAAQETLPSTAGQGIFDSLQGCPLVTGSTSEMQNWNIPEVMTTQ